jgi:quinoprotein glucose dehydrogenase
MTCTRGLLFRHRFALLLGAAALTASAGISDAVAAPDWPGYEGGPNHTSAYSGDVSLTPGNAAGLSPDWTFTEQAGTIPGQRPPRFDASPVVVGGRVYIGSRTGMLYSLDAATGTMVWSKQLDFGNTTACNQPPGIIGTAAVANDPVSGVRTVYAPGAHYLYALNASTGAQLWRQAIGPDTPAGTATYSNLSSPTVVGGKIYMGLSQACEGHRIRGGVVQLNQHTGQLLRTWFSVPPGQVGASVWTSVASAAGSVFVTTGNANPNASSSYDASSIVRLAAATMQKKDSWAAPVPQGADLDMGSSPVLFNTTLNGVATPMVAACNKNGVFYSWRRAALSAGPVWERRVGLVGGPDNPGDGDCLASGVFDPSAQRLIVASNPTNIGGTTYKGSVRALDPATGAIIWEKPMGDCTPFGTPTLNSSTKLLAVPCSRVIKG